MSGLWTANELDLIDTLTRRVRLMTLSQIAQIWWPDTPSHKPVRRELRRLRQAGLLQRTVLNAHPRPTLRRPLAAWQPGNSSPDMLCLSRRVKARWGQIAEPVEVVWASQLAANLFGSTARQLSELLHRDHDLLLAEVYVFYRRERPNLAARWLGENVFPKAGFRVKDPDAFLFGDDGRPIRVVESAGRYGLRQLNDFHEYCVEFDLPYEIW